MGLSRAGAREERQERSILEPLPVIGNRRESSPLGAALEGEPAFSKLRLDSNPWLALLTAIPSDASTRTPLATGPAIDDRRSRVPNVPPAPALVLNSAMSHPHALPRA